MRRKQVRLIAATALLIGVGLTTALPTLAAGTSAHVIGRRSVVTPAAAPVATVGTPPGAVPTTWRSVESIRRPLSQSVVVLYGDSLAWEARDFFVWALAGHTGVQVLTRTFGGTAICDWFDEMSQDAASMAPGMVVVEFSGNSLTPCMQDAAGRQLSGDTYRQKYHDDAEAVIALFAPHGTQVVFAGAPISRAAAQNPDFKGGGLNGLYAQIAAAHDGVGYVDAGAAVLDGGRWTETLPCLASEPCTGGVDAAGRGVDVVRAPDGGHFCPASPGAIRGVTGDCPVWSSGAFRYGSAMAAPVLAGLDASAAAAR